MPCTIEQRDAVRRAAERLAGCDHVVATDILTPEHSPLDCWTLEFVCDSHADGLPSRTLHILADEDLRLRDATSQGDPPHMIATASA